MSNRSPLLLNKQHDVYRRLPDGGDIRLVNIQPGAWGEPLYCELSYHSLDARPRPVYSTLSYVWGSPKATDSIFLNGLPWNVTVNLSTALHHLRDRKSFVRIWIDALCIDQSNNNERGSQVSFMKEIYSGSQETIVYLGDGRNHRPVKGIAQQPEAIHTVFYDDERDAAHLSEFLDSLKVTRRARPTSSFDMFCLLRILSDGDQVPLLTSTLSELDQQGDHTMRILIEDLRMLLLSPWWQRIWVVQEMTVSPNVVIRYGNLQAPWDMFVAAASSPFIQSATQPALSSISSDYVKVLRLFSRYVEDCESLRKQWTSYGGAYLLDLLQDFSSRRASDERDKIYALLSLVDTTQLGIVLLNYDSSIAKVYRQATIGLIAHSGSLSPWSGDLMRKNRKDLPSWVPDWSALYEEFDRRRAKFEHKYNACGHWSFSLQGTRLAYWRTIHDNMSLLLGDIENSSEPKRLPSKIGKALRFYYQQLSHHRDIHEKSLERLQAIQETYTRYNNEWPSEPGEALTTFHQAHVPLLGVPMDQGITKEILSFCHRKQWPHAAICNPRTCTGHYWRQEGQEFASHSRLETDTDESYTRITELVSTARVQYVHYSMLIQQYLDDCQPVFLKVQVLAEKLQEYCLSDNDESLQPWVNRLFSHSIIVYGELNYNWPVVSFYWNLEGPDSAPFWAGSNHGFTGPAIPELEKAQQKPPLLSTTPDGYCYPAEALSTMPASILSVESIRKGRVVKILGPKLITWTDKASAYFTLGEWIKSASASDLSGYEPNDWMLALARTLVADACQAIDTSEVDSRRSGGGLRRLTPDDDGRLFQWFQWILIEYNTKYRDKDETVLLNWSSFQFAEVQSAPITEEEKQMFDFAMVLATEGRVLFETDRNSLGLGPASMAVGDEVRVMPGGRTHLVLRQVEAEAAKVKGLSYSLIGDCYLDSRQGTTSTADEEPWAGGLPEDLLYNKSLGLQTLWGQKHFRERIYLF